MISPSSTCPPKPALAIPDGLVDALRDRTGVAVRFFDADGAPLPAGDGADAAGTAPDPSHGEPLARVVREAVEAGEDRVEPTPDGLAAAWPIRQHGRPAVVAAAVLTDVGPGEASVGRRLLAGVGEAVRARFALAEAANQCDSLSGALAQSF